MCHQPWERRRASPLPIYKTAPLALRLDPVDHLTTLWTNKTGLQGGFGGKRSCALRMSEGLALLQLDPLDHHFDPEGQAPTLWVRTN
jgi:hypothetical protein